MVVHTASYAMQDGSNCPDDGASNGLVRSLPIIKEIAVHGHQDLRINRRYMLAAATETL